MIALCPSNEILEGESREFTVNSVSLFVVRVNGALFAYRNSCPHLGIPLNWQPNAFLDAEGELIQCSSHGALFIIESGLCVFGPCKEARLSPVNIKEHNNKVFAHIDE